MQHSVLAGTAFGLSSICHDCKFVRAGQPTVCFIGPLSVSVANACHHDILCRLLSGQAYVCFPLILSFDFFPTAARTPPEAHHTWLPSPTDPHHPVPLLPGDAFLVSHAQQSSFESRAQLQLLQKLLEAQQESVGVMKRLLSVEEILFIRKEERNKEREESSDAQPTEPQGGLGHVVLHEPNS